MKLVLLLALMVGACAGPQQLTCRELAGRVDEFRDRRVVVAGVWRMGEHGSLLCSDEGVVIYLNRVPPTWYEYLSDPNIGSASVMACGVVRAAVRERFRSVDNPIGSIEVEESCSSVTRVVADGGAGGI